MPQEAHLDIVVLESDPSSVSFLGPGFNPFYFSASLEFVLAFPLPFQHGINDLLFDQSSFLYPLTHINCVYGLIFPVKSH